MPWKALHRGEGGQGSSFQKTSGTLLILWQEFQRRCERRSQAEEGFQATEEQDLQWPRGAWAWRRPESPCSGQASGLMLEQHAKVSWGLLSLEWLGHLSGLFLSGSDPSFAVPLGPWLPRHTSVDLSSCFPQLSEPWNRHCPSLLIQAPSHKPLSFLRPVPQTGGLRSHRQDATCTPRRDTGTLLTAWPAQE